MTRTPRVKVVKIGAGKVIFIDSRQFVAAMKAMGLLPRNWEPKRRPDDGKAKETD